MATSGDDAEVLAAALAAVGLEPSTPVRRLDRGWSGSIVGGLRVDGRPAVLKATPVLATTDPRRESHFYRELTTVPVRVPRLLRAAHTSELSVLLLERLRPAPPARDWTATTWQEVARQLGTLHGWSGFAHVPWLRDHDEPVASDVLAERRALWAELPAAGPALALFDDLDAGRAAIQALPACLVHGDCHAENLLTDPAGDLVWVDWQEVGRGHGPEDLALLWQRAEFNGAVVPRSATLSTYARARGLPDDERLARAVRAAEIELLLLGWPDFFLRDPDRPRERLFARLQVLAGR